MTRAQGKHREFSLNQSVATLIVLRFFSNEITVDGDSTYV